MQFHSIILAFVAYASVVSAYACQKVDPPQRKNDVGFVYQTNPANTNGDYYFKHLDWRWQSRPGNKWGIAVEINNYCDIFVAAFTGQITNVCISWQGPTQKWYDCFHVPAYNGRCSIPQETCYHIVNAWGYA